MKILQDKAPTTPIAGQQTSSRNRYMIGIKSEDSTARKMPERRLTPAERQAVWEEGKNAAALFQVKLKQYLATHGVPESDFTINNQGSLGAIIITCSPNVADLISKMSEVKTVVKDSKNVKLIE